MLMSMLSSSEGRQSLEEEDCGFEGIGATIITIDEEMSMEDCLPSDDDSIDYISMSDKNLEDDDCGFISVAQ